MWDRKLRKDHGELLPVSGVSDPGCRSQAKLPLTLRFLFTYQTEPGSEAARVQVRTKDCITALLLDVS